MASSTRHRLLTKMDQAIGCLVRAFEYMQTCHSVYLESNPTHALALEQLINSLIKLHEAIQQFRKLM